MQDKSWATEPLNGTWRGACATEAAARAIAGAATGDYFQLTTDGKFYKLNAGAGTTEVFRGNTAKFPRLSAIVAEAANVTIYDLTAAGRPMWMRFGPNIPQWGGGNRVLCTVAMLNASLVLGASTGGNGSITNTCSDYGSGKILGRHVRLVA